MTSPEKTTLTIVVLGNYADWLINFRGPMLKTFASQGHCVVACAPNASTDVRRGLKRLGVRYRHVYLHRGGISPLKDLLGFFQMLRLFHEIKPDIFWGYTVKPIVFGILAAKIARVPNLFAMIEGLGYVFAGNGRGRGLLRWVVTALYRLSMGLSHKVFFLNQDDRDYFVRQGLLTDSRKAVLLNGTGVDVDYYCPSPLPPKVSFLLITRLLVEKGVREYAAAAKRIRSKYPEIEFKLAGWFDDSPDTLCPRELNAWVDAGHVNYLGRLADVREAIGASSVFVLPSYYREGMPRTILEAMAMGRPIVTTDMPGCRETVVNRINGLLVRPKNVAALVTALEFFIENPDQIAAMGEESRRMAEGKFDVHMVNQAIIKAMRLP